MTKALLTLTALIALALPAAASAAGTTSQESAVLHQMNVVRSQHGLRPLRIDVRLERAARSQSKAMLTTGSFSHGAFETRMNRFDVKGSLIGENLAWGLGIDATPQAIVSAWLASAPHRANLLSPVYRRVGVADLQGDFEGYAGAHVVTADFAG